MTLRFAQAIAGFAPRLPLAVAYSGGADSSALLLACAEKWPQQVQAIHIHHGLQAAADDFAEHCRGVCAQLGVPLTLHKVDARNVSGQSPEDAARRARYQAFEALVQDVRLPLPVHDIAIAQHADDQVETILLALSRGSGLPGLSAMPAAWSRAGVHYHRPLLQVAGAEIRAWLKLRGLPHVEDPSNRDPQFTRNRIRACLLPALEATFPQFRDTFARSAATAAQAQELLLEVAAQDFLVMAERPIIEAIQSLSRARQTNLLRYWLSSCHQATPSAAQLAQLLHQIAACRTGAHRIHLKVADGFVERRGGELHWYNAPV